MASVIPMGQPVHGKADRNYREKIWNKMGQSVKASEKADYYERKAEAAENNNAIWMTTMPWKSWSRSWPNWSRRKKT